MDISHHRRSAHWVVTSLWLLCCFLGWCAGVEPTSNRTASAAAIALPPGFQLDKGFRLELVAAAPLVTSPVALAFYENGRLFGAEMPDASARGNAQPQPGRIRVLQDTNGDGAFETNMVYADNLPQPSALACYDGGRLLRVGEVAACS